MPPHILSKLPLIEVTIVTMILTLAFNFFSNRKIGVVKRKEEMEEFEKLRRMLQDAGASVKIKRAREEEARRKENDQKKANDLK